MLGVRQAAVPARGVEGRRKLPAHPGDVDDDHRERRPGQQPRPPVASADGGSGTADGEPDRRAVRLGEPQLAAAWPSSLPLHLAAPAATACHLVFPVELTRRHDGLE